MYYSYIGLIIPVLIFTLICQASVKSNYKKYSKVMNSRRMSGAMAASELLRLNGITDVRIVMINGNLTDNYNPKTKVISLSEGVYNSSSIAAVAIACHEAGHACQHAFGYKALSLRNAIIPITKIGSNIGIPLVLLGMFISSLEFLIPIGITMYSLVALFQFLTLPVEFNASKRALDTINNSNFLDQSEIKGAKKVLSAAAMTYVAALASSLVTILRLILISGRRR